MPRICLPRGSRAGAAFSPRRGAWLAAFGLASCFTAAHAADPAPVLLDPTPAKGWIITLGASLQFEPAYEGAKHLGFSGMPSLSWRRVGEPEGFSAPDDGLDFALYETDRFQIGVVGDFKSGRYSGSERKFFGLRDVPWTIQAGVFAEYWLIPERWRVRAEVKQGFHGHHGIVADLSSDWVERIGRFTLSAGPRLSLGNASFMNRNFGISPAEAALNGLYWPYRAGGGAKSAGAAAAVSYAWSETWSTTVFARYDRLLDEAANSPLVRVNGSPNQATIGVSVNYSFQIGG